MCLGRQKKSGAERGTSVGRCGACQSQRCAVRALGTGLRSAPVAIAGAAVVQLEEEFALSMSPCNSAHLQLLAGTAGRVGILQALPAALRDDGVKPVHLSCQGPGFGSTDRAIEVRTRSLDAGRAMRCEWRSGVQHTCGCAICK